MTTASADLELRDGRVDLDAGVVLRPDAPPQPLGPREAALLRHLAAAPGRTWSRGELLAQVWGLSDDTLSRAVDVAIARLRARIEARPASPEILVTVHGEGYRLVPIDGELMLSPTPAPRPVLLLGPTRLDLAARALRHPDGRVEALSPRETDVLERLADARGRWVPTDELRRKAWPDGGSRRALVNVVSRLRSRLEPDPRAPRFLLGRRRAGGGYRLDARPEQPMLARSDGAPIVGRDADLAQLRRLLVQHRLVTVLGPGGIGKTRLALELALESASLFPGGVCWVDLTDCRDQDDLLRATSSALGAPPEAGVVGAQAVARVLSARGACLVVLDNAETVWQRLAELLRGWMETALEVTFLATSRRRLRIDGEWPLELSPLAVEPAVSLLRNRGVPADPDLPRLAEQLEGIPLALELAAARAHRQPVAELLAGLDRRLDLAEKPLAPGEAGALRRSLDASWRLLAPAEQVALASTAVFRGGFTLDAAEAVVRVDDTWVIDALDGVREHSLLRVVEHPQGQRLDTFVVVREHAEERMDALGLRDQVEARHRAWYAALARSLLARSIARELESDRDLAIELPNCLHAFFGAPAGQRPVEIALAASDLLRRRMALDTLLPLLDAALAEPVEAACKARLHNARGQARLAAGLLDQAESDARAALDLAGAGAGVVPRARATLGCVALERGDFRASERHKRNSLRVARREGDSVMEVSALNNLGVLLQDMGDVEGAVACWTEALGKYTSPLHGAILLKNLASTSLALDLLAEAEAQLRDALAVFHGSSHLHYLGLAHQLLADVLTRRGADGEARAHRDAAAEVFATLGQDGSASDRAPRSP